MDIERAAPAPIDTKSFPLNTMNNNTHPIEFFILALLFLVEGICYIINELAGFHSTQQEITHTSPAPAPIASTPHIQPLLTDLTTLTVKQLRQLTGITNSRYRKHDLILAYASI